MSDPFSSGGFDPRMFEQVPLFRELAKVMSWSGGPINWDLARQTAEAVVEDRPVPSAAEDELIDAMRVAELWLDDASGLPSVDGPARAMTAREWVQAASSSEGLGTLVEPVARGMADVMSDALPEEMRQMMGGQPGAPSMSQAFGAITAMMYGVQVGTIAGNLGDQVLGCYDLGVPVIDTRTVGTVGDTLERFADDYDFDRTELRYWLSLREAAHRRIYAGVPWVTSHLTDLIGRFAAEADLDPTRMMDALGGMGFDPSDPEALQQALEQPDAFRVEPTTAQRAVLDRLQGLVALVEGYVGLVTESASGGKLGSLARIDEAMRRRRAEHGPGERFLAQLIGLDLKPADLRTGRSFCDAVVTARGQAGLDRLWQHADHLPSPEELSDPSRWLVRMAAVELGVGEDSDDDGPQPPTS